MFLLYTLLFIIFPHYIKYKVTMNWEKLTKDAFIIESDTASGNFNAFK